MEIVSNSKDFPLQITITLSIDEAKIIWAKLNQNIYQSSTYKFDTPPGGWPKTFSEKIDDPLWNLLHRALDKADLTKEP